MNSGALPRISVEPGPQGGEAIGKTPGPTPARAGVAAQGITRILHVVNTLATGGLEKGLVRVVRGTDPERFEHIVCTVREEGALADELPRDRVRLLCLNHTRPGYRFLVGDIARCIRQVKPDIVHSRNWSTIEAVMAGRLTRCGVVHSEHGFESADTTESRGRLLFRRTAYELAHRVFSVSSQLREIHSSRTGFPLTKIDVIHNGVDTQWFRQQHAVRARVRRELGLDEAVLAIGAVGRLEPVKDHMTLLRAATRLPDSPRWQILLAGDGKERGALERFLRDHAALAGRVRFLGSVSDVASFLNALDIYVLPSLSEGISNSLLEAMASGLPVVATAAGGNPEVVVDGTCGLLFPVGGEGDLASHLVRLLGDSRFRVQLGREAVSHIDRSFSLEAMMAKYEELYAGLGSRRHA